MFPFQYSSRSVFGVPPLNNFERARIGPTFQPFGILPRGNSWKESGKRATVSVSMPEGWRPSALARTGSKSKNQDLKMARAIASSVSFIRWFNSILSSSAPKICEMPRCSERGGMGSRKLGISAHFRLSKTAPTFMNFPICSHQSVPRTSQRRKGGCTLVPSARRRTRFWPKAKSNPGGTNAVSPGLHRRDSTTS